MVTKTKSKKETKSLDVIVPGGHIELIQHIKLGDLSPNPYQPATRVEIDPETAKKFGESIREHGLIMMPVAREMRYNQGNVIKYQVGDGWLRYKGYCWLLANGHSEYAEMPCVVKDLTDQQMADMVMEANTVRQDLNPIELAKLYKRYIKDFNIPQAELARKHNCSQGEIANTIRLLELHPDLQAKIISQEISETHGRQLLRLNYNSELQKEVLERTIKEGYSVNQLSNEIAGKIYRASENLEPNEYPKPGFDVKECEKCPNRQKIGSPYSSEKKTWRCLDKACYEKKTKQTEQARVDQLQAEIAVAKKDAGDKKKDKVLDLSKLTWRDYESLDGNYKKIDKSECRNCHKRAVGKNYNGKPESVCIDVKCFKSKEKAYQAKEAAKAREVEHQLTERVKVACANLRDESTPFKLILDYLLSHSRKDTREKFARMYELKESELVRWFAVNIPADEPEVIIRTAALILQMERFEGVKGIFQKMLAELEGTGAEIEKALAAHRAKHCKGCRHDDGNCKQLLKRYGEGWHDKCHSYSKGSVEEEDKEPEEEDEGTLESEEATANPTEAEIDADTAKAETKSSDYVEHELTHFEITLASGELVKVAWEPAFNNHLEFRGKAISETGYRSDFTMEQRSGRGEPAQTEFTLEEVVEYAKKRAEELAAELAAKPNKGKGKKKIVAKQERAKEFEVDKADLGEQELLSFQFKYCDGCHWADQEKVGTGHSCCTFITTPHIVDGECRTRKVGESTSDNASDNKDPLAELVIHTATHDSGDHFFQLGKVVVQAKTLRACVLGLAAQLDWGKSEKAIIETLRGMPATIDRDTLLAIMEGENEGA